VSIVCKQGWRQGDQHQFGARRVAVSALASYCASKGGIKMAHTEFSDRNCAVWHHHQLHRSRRDRTPINKKLLNDPVKLKSVLETFR